MGKLTENIQHALWMAGQTPVKPLYEIGTEKELGGVLCVKTESGWVPKESLAEEADERTRVHTTRQWQTHHKNLMDKAEIVHDMLLHMGGEGWHHKLDHADKELGELENQLHTMLQVIAKARGKG